MLSKRIALLVLTLWTGSVCLLPNAASAAESRQHEPLFTSLKVGLMGLNWLLGFVKDSDVEWILQVDNDTNKTLNRNRTGVTIGISGPDGQVASDGTNRVFGNGATTPPNGIITSD